MMTFLKFVILVATLMTGVQSNGATEKPESYSCYFDWCSPLWQYCNADEERCSPCSWDVCGRSSNIPKNCTQACKELLSPKTTTQASGLLAESKGDHDRLEAINQQLQTLRILVIVFPIVIVILIVIVAAVFGFVLYKRRKTCCRNDDDAEEPEEKRPLQATESSESSVGRDSSSLQNGLYDNQYPGQTALDKGEPPICRPIAVGPNQPSMYSRPDEQAQTSLASLSPFSGPPPYNARGAGAMSMPGSPGGQGLTGCALPLSMPLTQQEGNRIQDHKGFNADFDVSGNMGTAGHDRRYFSNDTDNTAPKSNDFGTRPVDA